MKKILLPVIGLLTAALLAFILWPKAQSAPAFALPDLHGKTVSNADLKGKVTLINFWYPSCPGCVSEMPKLIQTAKDYQGKDFQILAISLPYDPLESVINYTEERQLPFTVMYDGKNETGNAFGVKVAPTSFFINKQGELLKTFVGEPDFNALYQDINAELAK
ncbi:peroxiredoxin family protein [Neisseria weaveri]|uniref:Putative thioredoxin n=1 Tax=Neisseria weaveri TaxID=28091 RepID=A0A448VN66_9NEIS|nr:TlpA disulfide reductase family protein [Neisseria weaveri]EGV36801.1 putative thioredoxin [Neisseria weaveri LMG 5135]EGV37283.1 putative thioredoxin [Neisseria weaveri ATCC 51223]SAY51795.1 putative thioredoxin [Neisseria weaveri]VEJ51216.1 putative thioredoxin [Neisseria weaveri]